MTYSVYEPHVHRVVTHHFDNAKRRDFARLYPGAAVLEAGSSHNVPQDQPQAVIDAIRKVLAARPARPAPGTRPDKGGRQ